MEGVSVVEFVTLLCTTRPTFHDLFKTMNASENFEVPFMIVGDSDNTGTVTMKISFLLDKSKISKISGRSGRFYYNTKLM